MVPGAWSLEHGAWYLEEGAPICLSDQEYNISFYYTSQSDKQTYACQFLSPPPVNSVLPLSTQFWVSNVNCFHRLCHEWRRMSWPGVRAVHPGQSLGRACHQWQYSGCNTSAVSYPTVTLNQHVCPTTLTKTRGTIPTVSWVLLTMKHTQVTWLTDQERSTKEQRSVTQRYPPEMI